jgi:hypothetical protein
MDPWREIFLGSKIENKINWKNGNGAADCSAIEDAEKRQAGQSRLDKALFSV